VQSEAGKGTTISLQLPSASAQNAQVSVNA